MIRLFIFKEVTVRLPQKRIKKLFESIMSEETDSHSSGRINIVFTTDSKIKKLNSAYRNKDKATDVLSFNIDKPDSPQAVLGEIYISTMTAGKQAREYETTFDDEVLRLVCHGLLHLLGYDHIKTKERRIMEKRERFFLSDTLYS